MEAEELLKKFKKYVEQELGSEYESIITPTMYDPHDLQYNVSFIVMQKIKNGMIPKFHINVKDLIGINNLKKIKIDSLK